MGISQTVDGQGIAEVVMDNPPVNALTVAGWFDLARIVRGLGEDPAVRVVVLRAEGRGFNAGVDIKEMQATEGFDALIGANRGCYAAFAAVYECAVPVIAAVNGFCLGGGIGLVGNADIIVASDDATFGLPEVDRGALGAATHLARLVPQHRMRAMVYTSATATAAELHHFGSVLRVVPLDELRDAAFEVAGQIAAKSPTVIRAAKESLNGIDPIDVKRSYRFEQGFTFELNLSGVADEHRDAFVAKRETDTERVSDKRMTEDDVVAELRDGMTIGVGGLGVAAQADEPHPRDRPVVAAGPHDRRVRRPRHRPALRGGQGQPGRLPVLLARHDRARAALPGRPPDRRGLDARARRGHVPARAAGRGVAGAVHPDPGRARLRHRRPPARDPHRSRRPTTTARSWWPRRRSRSTSR